MKNKNIIITIIVSVITALITGILTTYASNYLFNSNEVSYNNNSSGIESDNVQGAIDELYEEATTYSQMRQLIYPVGSIYISVTDDTVAKVEARYGGTWEVFGAGRTIIGVGTGTDANSTSKTFAINETSGEYSHQLTQTEMPTHSHGIGWYENKGSASTGSKSANMVTQWWNVKSTPAGVGEGAGYPFWITPAGGNGYHNIIQPYITVYMYKRTA